jgi:hypothetical protein
MKEFLAVFTGSAEATERSGWNALSDAERQAREAAGVAAWGRWMEIHHDQVVNAGGPLGRTRKVSREGITDIRNNLAAWVVVRAESHEAAARLFEGHPHFMIFPGEAVEIMECLPVPRT